MARENALRRSYKSDPFEDKSWLADAAVYAFICPDYIEEEIRENIPERYKKGPLEYLSIVEMITASMKQHKIAFVKFVVSTMKVVMLASGGQEAWKDLKSQQIEDIFATLFDAHPEHMSKSLYGQTLEYIKWEAIWGSDTRQSIRYGKFVRHLYTRLSIRAFDLINMRINIDPNIELAEKEIWKQTIEMKESMEATIFLLQRPGRRPKKQIRCADSKNPGLQKTVLGYHLRNSDLESNNSGQLRLRRRSKLGITTGRR